MRIREVDLRFLLTIAFSVALSLLYSQNNDSFDSLSKELIQTNDEKARANILIALSAEVEGNRPENALTYAMSAHEIAVNHHLDKENILSLVRLGNCYMRLSNYREALINADQALELATKLNLKDEIAKSRTILALIYYELGNYEQSAKLDFENLAYYEQVKNQKQIGVVLGNIGIDFISQNNYEKGLEYLKKSFDIAVETNDFRGMSYQYNNIASLYADYFKDYSIALRYFKEALKINKKLDDKQQHGIYLMNIGNCLSKLDENDSVLWYFQSATRIFKGLNNTYLLSKCQSQISSYYLKTNDLHLSILHADTALQIGQKYNYHENIKAAAELLHKINLIKNDTIKAYRYAIIEDEEEDSLVILLNQKEVYKLEFQYSYEKSDKIKQIARQKKENLMVVIIISLISGLVIILLIFSRYRIKAKSVAIEKRSIEKELEFKNKELTINLLSLIKKNEMLSEISNKMVEIGKDAKKDETKDAINKISRELRNSSDDKMMKEFSLRFQEIHSGFYETLLHNYPELTQNELKLCAFLRLNMSTKDISELTGQRFLTIDQARFRLRKKLGITNSETNLVTFLSQI